MITICQASLGCRLLSLYITQLRMRIKSYHALKKCSKPLQCFNWALNQLLLDHFVPKLSFRAQESCFDSVLGCRPSINQFLGV